MWLNVPSVVLNTMQYIPVCWSIFSLFMPFCIFHDTILAPEILYKVAVHCIDEFTFKYSPFNGLGPILIDEIAGFVLL